MALSLTGDFETPYGTTVPQTYWRWDQLGVSVGGSTVNVLLLGYVSALAYATGKQPIGQRQYSVKGADFAAVVLTPPDGPTLSDALSRTVYDFVKQTDPFFAAAVDVE